jgi:hypothetical protein
MSSTLDNLGQIFQGPNSLKSTKILSHFHPFGILLHSHILPCKDTKGMTLMESIIVMV